jgi:hypothetical protein
MQGMGRTHFTQTALLDRAGWTATLVSRLRAEPAQRKTGSARAMAEIRRRVYSTIRQTYPALSDECERQIEARQ